MSRHDDKATFGARLRAARVALGWTQKELGRQVAIVSSGKINLGESEVSRYERGKIKNPRLDVVAALEEATGVSLVDEKRASHARDLEGRLEELSDTVDEILDLNLRWFRALGAQLGIEEPPASGAAPAA